ncbi:MAG TPA: c-type cytochrome [Bryobacteraceae bacterium]|nr:c-type cytochrome [Bryobacteraceae bacterium]
MGDFVVVMGVVGLLAQGSVMRNPRTSPGDIAAGAKTFRSHCAVCHGPNGEGGRGPRLASGVFYHGNSDQEILNNISNGIPGTEMPSMFYEEDRLWQVVAYIRSLSAASSAKGSGDPGRGREIFLAKGCMQCHRVNGEGGRLGPDLTDIGQRRAAAYLRESILDPSADVGERYWVVSFNDPSGKSHNGFVMNEDTYSVQFLDFNEQLQSFEKAGLKDYQVVKTSKMPSYKSVLSDQEVDDLVAWLSSLRLEGGAR